MELNKDFYQKVAASCTLHNMRRTARAVTDLYETILSPSGVHATQFTLLVAINQYDPASVSGLAQGLHTDRTTLTRTLKPLQKNGWIEIAPGRDRRVHEVRLTDAGQEALAKAVPLWEQAQAHIQQKLGKERWQELLNHLQATATLNEE